MRIFILDEDPKIAWALAQTLEGAGHETEIAHNDADGLQIASDTYFDIIVLGHVVSESASAPLIERIREKGISVPLIIVSSNLSSEDIVSGLNGGADDYMERPACPSVLLARIMALSRRSKRHPDSLLIHENIELDLVNLELRLDGKPIETTTLEFRLLRYLVQRKWKIVSTHELETALYPTAGMRQSNSVQVYIGKLRRKLGKSRIRNIRGHGYRFG